MNIDHNKLNKYKDDLVNKFEDVSTRLEELSNEYKNIMKQYDTTVEELKDFIKDGYLSEIKKINHHTIYELDNGSIKELSIFERRVICLSIDSIDDLLQSVREQQKSVNNITFTDIHSDINIETNIIKVDDLTKTLKSIRPKTGIDKRGNPCIPKGKFSIHYRILKSNGKYIYPTHLCDGYMLNQDKLNKIITNIMVNNHYKLEVVFGSRYIRSDNWITAYTNPSEIAKELYEFSKL